MLLHAWVPKVIACWLTPQAVGLHFEMVTVVTLVYPHHSVSIYLILSACIYVYVCEYMDMHHVF